MSAPPRVVVPIVVAAWVPHEIREWFQNSYGGDKTTLSPAGERIARVLSSIRLVRHGRSFVREFQSVPEYVDKLTNFLEEAASVPERFKTEPYLTPTAAAGLLEKTAADARRLANRILKYPALFSFADDQTPTQEALAGERTGRVTLALEQFATALDRRRKDDGLGYPQIGRRDGKAKRSRNEQVRQIAIMAKHHLGGVYPTFTAAVASEILNLKEPIGESGLRQLVSGLAQTTLEPPTQEPAHSPEMGTHPISVPVGNEMGCVPISPSSGSGQKVSREPLQESLPEK